MELENHPTCDKLLQELVSLSWLTFIVQQGIVQLPHQDAQHLIHKYNTRVQTLRR